MAITNTYLIQSAINDDYQLRNNARASDGTLYHVYTTTVDNYFRVAYSVDGGINWTESYSGAAGSTGVRGCCAIDSADVLHVIYNAGVNTDIMHRTFTISGGWGVAETAGTANMQSNYGLDLAIDASDNIHVICGNLLGDIKYTKKTGGSWSTNLILSGGLGNPPFNVNPRIAIDGNGDIYAVWSRGLGVNDNRIAWAKYTSGTWISAVELYSGISNPNNKYPSIVIDTSNNVHLVWTENGNGIRAAGTWYAKFNFGTDIWDASPSLANATELVSPSIGVDTSNRLYIVGNLSIDIYEIIYNGSWGAANKVLSATGINSFRIPILNTPVWPFVGGISVCKPTVGYYIVFDNVTGGVNTSRFASTTDMTYVLSNKNYTKASTASLASNDNNLGIVFTTSGYSNVLTVDSIFEDQVANNQYAVILFKNKANNSTNTINVSWVGKTSLAPSTSTVYLQIYNRNSTTWETLDSNGTASANSSFSLTGTKTTSLSNYYNGTNWVSFRVYQLAQ